ncbi:2-oxoglutarate dehydrogenase, E2 component, dihydrolipoamide succinyltransferase [Aquipuribacter sp. MA13-13]|uniref:2-oxoglutarate dehydrogenase, E2 component, dihydrolipoamide succinyltransferase n=1 Tax=Aquipuribacter sp. MA13-13 TaxID=3440840 RepID=UPI003EEFD58F
MANPVNMPPLGESVTEGTVTRWLKQVGDRVEQDEPLVEIATDKVDTEIPSPFAGTLLEISVDEDETAEVGSQLAVIGEESEAGGSGDGGSDGSSGSSGSDEPASSGEASGSDLPAAQDSGSSGSDAQGSQDSGSGDPGPQDEVAAEDADEPADTPSTAADAPAEKPSADTQQGGGGTEIVMPALGESVTEGTITRWLKAEGDTVEVDEPIVEVATDKVGTEIPSPVAGTVLRIIVGADETAEVDEPSVEVATDKVDTEIPSPVAGTVLRIIVGEDETAEVGAPLVVVGDPSASGGSAPDGDAGGEAPAEAPAQEEAPKDEAPKDEAPAADAEDAAAEEPTTQDSSAEQYNSAESQVPQPTALDTSPTTTSSEQGKGGEGQSSGGSAASTGGMSAVSGGDASGYITPIVRKLAAEKGVDLSEVSGTGVGGRIRRQDVLAAAEAAEKAAQQPAPAEAEAPAPAAAPKTPAKAAPAAEVSAKRGTREKMTRLRKVIAQRMVESLQVSAQLTTVVEVDVTRVSALRNRAKGPFQEREGVKLSFLPFFALAAVEALKAFPVVNSSIDGDEVVYHGAEHLGMAVDTERGLLVPVIKDAGDLNIAGLARKIADLAERTRTNSISPDDLSGGTFTLTNTGSRGALFDTPILNQPQVAILGTGAVVKRPTVVTDSEGNESIAVRSMVYLALSYDHRIVDGAEAARFLSAMKQRLEDGAFESDLGL